MPGLIYKIVEKSLRENKPRYEHYVPRDYEAMREELKRNTTKQPLPKRIKRTKAQYGYWYELEGANRNKVVMLVHGGGFNSGSAEYSYNTAIMLLKSKDFAVFNVEYRLAPENPYSAGLEDCVSAYKYLLSLGIKSKDIVLAGDSAGGNLVFALALFLRDENIDMPAGICGISPVAALDDSMPSRTEREPLDCIIGPDFTEEMMATYVLDHDPKNPYLSPVYGDFKGLPPIWICVGTNEVFYDDAFALKEKAERAGIEVELIVGKGMCHVYPNIPDKASTIAKKSMYSFVRRMLCV